MVGREVEKGGSLGAEEPGVLELEAGGLADDRRVGVDLADQARDRDADVARDRDRLAGAAEDVAEQCARGGLAVGAGDGEEAVGERAPGELELTDHVDLALQRGRDHRRLPRYPWALDDRVRSLELSQTIRIQDHFDAPPGKTFRALGMPRIDRAGRSWWSGSPVRARPTTRNGPR